MKSSNQLHFPNTFTESRIGDLSVPNKLVFAATSSELGDQDGFFGPEAVEFYAERARGGVGLIIVEATYVDPAGKRLHQNAMLHDDKYIPSLRLLVEAVKREGSKIAIQLCHGGRDATPSVTGSSPLAPSPIASSYIGVGEPVIPVEMTIAQIELVIARFVAAAARAKDAGFDAVEIHGAHGYLISQFFSPHTNRRTDIYGGSLEGRARVAVEIVQGMKKALGSRYPVIVRMNGNDFVPGGLTIDDAVEIAALLEAAGADALSVSGGVHASRPYMVIPGMSVGRNCFAEETKAMRRRLEIPVMTVGRIKTPELVEDIISGGDADFVCLSRALIADPFFPAKAKAGLQATITPCIACNECIAVAHRHERMACTVNPLVGRELQFKEHRFSRPKKKKIAVIGSGAAGLSAATTAARRGHEVHLYERSEKLGGQLNLASMPPNREEIGTLLDFYKRELQRLSVHVHLGEQLREQDASNSSLDAIIVATGARAVKPTLPGSDLPHVVSGWEVLSGHCEPGNNCVVIGGGLVGIEVADHLATHGRNVVLIARSDLLRKAVHADRVYFMERIEKLKIEVMTHTKVWRVGTTSVEVEPNGRIRRSLEGIDSVIFCMGYESRKDETLDFIGSGVPVHYVGDVLGPRKFFQAVGEGTLASMSDFEPSGAQTSV